MKPEPSTHSPYFSRYIDLVEETDLLTAFDNLSSEGHSFWLDITEEQGNFRYAEGKWSIKEVLQHIIDTERIFAYRALAIARGDTTSLPGYDENTYAANSEADSRLMEDLVDELFTLRNATTTLFSGLTDAALDRIGTANGASLSALAAGFIIVGHELHHVNVVKDRYLTES
ncbi:MAG: DinB family protein [Flavobacteriales bacterium]|nr:DinB family protein [Flavobacteriales bacterium]